MKKRQLNTSQEEDDISSQPPKKRQKQQSIHANNTFVTKAKKQNKKIKIKQKWNEMINKR